MTKLRFQDLILFEDSDYIIINKPAFISSLDDRKDFTSIIELAREYNPDIQLGHRLDKDTSGCLAIAKNHEAYRHLAIQFEQRKVDKRYHALCDGVHNFEDNWIELPLYKNAKGFVKVDKRRGKKAATHFQTLEQFKYHTLVECKPLTGRMHQIRVHLASQQAPISGDETYGGKPFYLSQLKRKFNLKKGAEEHPLIKRIALHAIGLSFYTAEGKNISAEADYPKDFNALLKQLRLRS